MAVNNRGFFGKFFPKQQKRETVLFCFSPPIMLATVIVESALALWTLFRYRQHLLGKIAVVILLLLAAFQISEYQVCGNHSAEAWSKFGLVAITLLPVFGLRLISLITKKKSFLVLGSIIAAVLVLCFIFIPVRTRSIRSAAAITLFSPGPRRSTNFSEPIILSF